MNMMNKIVNVLIVNIVFDDDVVKKKKKKFKKKQEKIFQIKMFVTHCGFRLFCSR